MPELLLAIDVGTSALGAFVFTPGGVLLARASVPIRSRFPAPGRVEQDAVAVWRSARRAVSRALSGASRAPADIAAVGLTSQRASAVLWDRATGRPLGPMVVWSDLRGLDRARELREAGFMVAPQQAAAKLERMVAEAPEAAALARAGRLAWGNIDSFLLWKLTGGSAHVTDRSQAWPAGYLELGSWGWNAGLIAHQGLEPSMFPALVDTWGPIGTTSRRAFGAEVPVTAVVADQQSATIGQGCEARGASKVSYGTSATLDLSTGGDLVFCGMSTPPFVLSSAAGETRFCVEGMVYSAGSALDWLRSAFRLGDHRRFEALAAAAPDGGGVAFLPALQGLGAPYGEAERRGLLAGLSTATGPGQIARAGLEGLAFRVREMFDFIYDAAEAPRPAVLRVDGGLTGSDALMQAQADLLGLPVARHALREATACGAAICAARGAGLLTGSELAGFVRHDRAFEPTVGPDEADARFAAWKQRVYAQA
jgi:glycerol kinase